MNTGTIEKHLENKIQHILCTKREGGARRGELTDRRGRKGRGGCTNSDAKRCSVRCVAKATAYLTFRFVCNLLSNNRKFNFVPIRKAANFNTLPMRIKFNYIECWSMNPYANTHTYIHHSPNSISYKQNPSTIFRPMEYRILFYLNICTGFRFHKI